MKFIIFICFVIIATFASLTDAAATKVECFDEKTNHRWAAGTEYRPVGTCVTIKCDAKGGKSALTCPASVGGPNCQKVDGNIRKAYPDCCSTFKCSRS